MQSDDVIWDIIKTGHCSFKTKVTNGRTFCRNVNNVNGLCKKPYCPLANSRYATIREKQGRCYLYIKTAERAHCPRKLWEMIKLPKNYLEAIKIVSEHLRFFPKPLKHRNKQRLTKIHQYLIRMRKLRLQERTKLVGINKKVERREKKREAKALVAAKLTENIEKELLDRLKQGTYKDIYNFPEMEYTKALNKAGKKYENENEEEEEEEEDELEDELEESDEENDEPDIQFIEDFEESDQDIEDSGDFEAMGSDLDDDFAFADEIDDDDDNDDEEEDEQKSNSRKRQSLKYDSDDSDNDDGFASKQKPVKRSKKETSQKKSNKRQKKSQGTHINIEYEQEEEEPRQLQRQSISKKR